jgi:hypothetical protein
MRAPSTTRTCHDSGTRGGVVNVRGLLDADAEGDR